MNRDLAEDIPSALIERLGDDFFVDGGYILSDSEIKETIVKALMSIK